MYYYKGIKFHIKQKFKLIFLKNFILSDKILDLHQYNI